MKVAVLINGIAVTVTDAQTAVVLPGNKIVVTGMAQDTAEQAATARELGYGDDVAQMVLDHDPLHACLCAWLGLPTSYALSESAGTLDPADQEKAWAEEAAVIAVQKFMRLAGGCLPL